MAETARLGLPLLAAAQAQKHVTHNEALVILDSLCGLAVRERGRGSPPATPAEGDAFLVAAGAGGAWTGQGGSVAVWRDGAWHFTVPRAGLVAFVITEGRLLVHDGTGWRDLDGLLGSLRDLAGLGIGTAPDSANPFAAKLNGALWTARGTAEGGTGDLRYTLNKDGAARVLSFLFQSGYSGRAEIGLVGDDDLQVKVSADGSGWTEALRVKGNGRVGIGTATPAERLTVAGTIAPATDNAFALGTPALRVSTIYAATGTINTSDARLKTAVAPVDPDGALALLAAAPPITFRWIEGGRDGETGDPIPGRRRHLGWRAQDWAEALDGAGLDLGLLVRTAPGDGDAPLGLRADQITALQHAAILRLAARLDAAETRLAALEGRPV